MASVKVILETPESKLWIVDNFVSSSLQEELSFHEEPEIVVYGRVCRQKRDVAFYSDESKGYHYSGRLMPSQPLTPGLRDLMKEVNTRLGTKFNGILANRYMDGSKYIGAHSDDESSLSRGVVAAISYGATRKFRIRDKVSKKIVVDIEVGDKSLLVMEGNFQREFTHEIPMQKRTKEERESP